MSRNTTIVLIYHCHKHLDVIIIDITATPTFLAGPFSQTSPRETKLCVYTKQHVSLK
jgi:hypothetical protein